MQDIMEANSRAQQVIFSVLPTLVHKSEFSSAIPSSTISKFLLVDVEPHVAVHLTLPPLVPLAKL